MLCTLTLAGLVLLTAPLPQVAASPTTYYVSPNGNDADSGANDAPFKTVEHAKSIVRQRIAAGLNQPLTILLREGIYELSAPLGFDKRDSGTQQCGITYAAYPKEHVTLSGGRQIIGFAESDGIWHASLPLAKRGDWFFRQLVVAGKRAVRARWPNEDGELRLKGVFDEVTRFQLDQDIPAQALAGQSTELVIYQNWSTTRGLIVGSQLQQVITATQMGWIGHGESTTASIGKPAYLEHAREFLDRPSEWFLDTTTGVLSYIPRDGEQIENTEATAPVLRQLIRIAGTKGKPVRNLTFRDIHFEHTRFDLPAIGYSEIQATHYGPKFGAKTFVQPVAIECIYAESCRFDHCKIAHIAASGIGLGQGCHKVVIDDCSIKDIGGSGVMIGWRGKAVLGEGSEGRLDGDWADPEDAPSAVIVSNCHIENCGVSSRGGVGIFVAFSADIQIANNLIHDLPYTGISIGFRWNTSATSQQRCIVERNHIHDVMRVLADGGGIYTLGWQPGTVIRENYIHDVHRSRFAHGNAPNNGFFIDQGSKGLRFERNVVHHTSGAAVRFNQSAPTDQEWLDNLLDDSAATSQAAKVIVKRTGPQLDDR